MRRPVMDIYALMLRFKMDSPDAYGHRRFDG